jgi:hypothetical protein
MVLQFNEDEPIYDIQRPKSSSSISQSQNNSLGNFSEASIRDTHFAWETEILNTSGDPKAVEKAMVSLWKMQTAQAISFLIDVALDSKSKNHNATKAYVKAQSQDPALQAAILSQLDKANNESVILLLSLLPDKGSTAIDQAFKSLLVKKEYNETIVKFIVNYELKLEKISVLRGMFEGHKDDLDGVLTDIATQSKDEGRQIKAVKTLFFNRFSPAQHLITKLKNISGRVQIEILNHLESATHGEYIKCCLFENADAGVKYAAICKVKDISEVDLLKRVAKFINKNGQNFSVDHFQKLVEAIYANNSKDVYLNIFKLSFSGLPTAHQGIMVRFLTVKDCDTLVLLKIIESVQHNRGSFVKELSENNPHIYNCIIKSHFQLLDKENKIACLAYPGGSLDSSAIDSLFTYYSTNPVLIMTQLANVLLPMTPIEKLRNASYLLASFYPSLERADFDRFQNHFPGIFDDQIGKIARDSANFDIPIELKMKALDFDKSEYTPGGLKDLAERLSRMIAGIKELKLLENYWDRLYDLWVVTGKPKSLCVMLKACGEILFERELPDGPKENAKALERLNKYGLVYIKYATARDIERILLLPVDRLKKLPIKCHERLEQKVKGFCANGSYPSLTELSVWRILTSNDQPTFHISALKGTADGDVLRKLLEAIKYRSGITTKPHHAYYAAQVLLHSPAQWVVHEILAVVKNSYLRNLIGGHETPQPGLLYKIKQEVLSAIHACEIPKWKDRIRIYNLPEPRAYEPPSRKPRPGESSGPNSYFGGTGTGS